MSLICLVFLTFKALKEVKDSAVLISVLSVSPADSRFHILQMFVSELYSSYVFSDLMRRVCTCVYVITQLI